MLSVYAYWDTLSDGNHTRRGTLLCFGEDERIIGNVVLKNPGSAAPLEGDDCSLFGRIDGRLQFAPDATMYAIADLFEMDRRTGIVRLYNLLDFRDVNPEKALVSSCLSEDSVAEDILSGPAVPTYLGWGDLWKQPNLLSKAREIFQAALPNSPYLDAEIERNEFIHPLYLMRYGLKQERCLKLLDSFRNCLK